MKAVQYLFPFSIMIIVTVISFTLRASDFKESNDTVRTVKMDSFRIASK